MPASTPGRNQTSGPKTVRMASTRPTSTPGTICHNTTSNGGLITRTEPGAGPGVPAGYVGRCRIAAHPDCWRCSRLLRLEYFRKAPRRPGRCRPRHRVGDDPAHLGLVIHRIVLVSGTEVEHPAMSAAPAAPGPEHLTSGETGDEHQLVRCGHVEVLPVHLIAGYPDRLGHAVGDRVGGVHGPHQFTVPGAAPPQVRGGAHQRAEDLGVMG